MLTFALTVTDTGGLSDSDTTVVTITAVGVPTYTLNIHIEGQGSVTRDPPGTVIVPLQSSYFSGTHVTLGASPAIGWTFVHWTGDLASTANPAQITMDADKVITATFVVEHRIYLPLVLRNAP